MSALRSPFLRSFARVSSGLAALLAFQSAFAADEYVVYGKRAPLMPEVDRIELRGALVQPPSPVAGGEIADSVRAALADALRAIPTSSDQRLASNDPRPRA
jgi:hypothetical protein